MKIGRLLLRTIVGGLFVGHGTQKLLGWFGGQGLDATAQGFDSMGLRPGRINATVAGAGEALGGAALATGYRTPLASSALIGSMLVAIKHVHAKNGPWAQQGGFEYNLVLLGAVFAIAEAGPGPISLDALRHKERSGVIWALFALALGAGAAAGVDALAASKAPIPAPEPAGSPAPAAPEPPAAPASVAPESPAAPAPTESPVPPVVQGETLPGDDRGIDEPTVTDAEVAGDDAAQ